VTTAAQPWAHTTVLLAEAVDALVRAPDGAFVDGTFGRGGHARAILARLGARGSLVAFDKDPQAIAAGASIADARLKLVHAGFSAMPAQLAQLGIAQLDGVLLDLGVSSPQLDDPARGFSFRFDAPLDMRMDTTRGETAADFLARADERELTQVIRDYGEERFAVQVAKALVARRQGGAAIRTTGQLAEVVAGAVKTREPGQNPATRTFQALRIHVNAELEELEQGLNAALRLLAPHGRRLVVISFHSLEDRWSRPSSRAKAATWSTAARRLRRRGRAGCGAGPRHAPAPPRSRQPARALGRDARGRTHGGGLRRTRGRGAARPRPCAAPRRPWERASVTRVNLLLLAALLASALYLVKTAYESRRLFNALTTARVPKARACRPSSSGSRPSGRRRPRTCGWRRWRARSCDAHRHAGRHLLREPTTRRRGGGFGAAPDQRSASAAAVE
jgi:16S rRNA (cytosine1402-N4)-methyltransferase